MKLTILVSLLLRLVLYTPADLARADPTPRRIAPNTNVPGAPCPIFRRSFALDDQPTKATVRIIGLGHYQLRCNGWVVGDTVSHT